MDSQPPVDAQSPITSTQDSPQDRRSAFRIPNSALRAAGWLMSLVGIGGYLNWINSGVLVREGNWIALDFHVYYQAAKVLGRGEDIYLAGISPPYIYPPLLAILILPLSWLHATTATIIWKLSQHLCLLAAGWLLVRLLPATIRPLGAGVLFLGWLTVPVKSEILVGQVNSLVLLLVVGAIYAIFREGRGPGVSREVTSAQELEPGVVRPLSAPWHLSHIFAGLLLALAVSIKVLPVLLVAYLWWRGPRVVAAMATAGVVSLQLISLLITPATARFWLEVFPALFREEFHSPDNQSLNATISRALLPGNSYSPTTQLFDGAAVRPIITWLANLLVLLVVAWVLWRSSKRASSIGIRARAVRGLLEVSLVMLAIHLVSGSTWPHHLVALSIPMTALLGAWWLEREGTNQRTRTALWWLPLVLGAGLALFLRSPEEWQDLASTVAPQTPGLTLFASSLGTLVIIAWSAAISVILLGSSKSNVQGLKSKVEGGPERVKEQGSGASGET